MRDLSGLSPLTHIVHDWAVRCFGREHVASTKVRALRLAEEAIELCQAAGLDDVKIHKLVDIVYDRPKGEVVVELAGVLMTAHVLSASFGLDPQDVMLTELRRVLGKPPAHFRERNDEKIAMGLDE